MRNALLEKIEKLSIHEKPVEINVGDTVKVMQKVTEGNKVRSQSYEGTVIKKQGTGARVSFTVRRISFGEGVEKTFPLHSPTVQSVTVTRKGKARKAKLYYLRNKSGKEGRIESAMATGSDKDAQ